MLVRRSSLILVIVAGIKRKHRCSQCLADDCGTCKFCLDKLKFGGKRSKNLCCIKSRCTVYLTHPSNTRNSSTFTNKGISVFTQVLFTSMIYINTIQPAKAFIQQGTSSDTSSIDNFLFLAGRKRMIDCMFKSLECQLTGFEDHMAVCTLITRFENLNKQWLKAC